MFVGTTIKSQLPSNGARNMKYDNFSYLHEIITDV